MKTKKFLSFALVLAMLVGMIPGMSLTASAEGNTTTITPGSDEAKTGTGTMTITLHIHDFTEYKLGTTNAANDTIIATCKETTYHTGGQNYEAKLTIAAPTAGGGAANITDTDGIQGTTEVKYYKKDGSSWTDNGTTAPSGDGFFKASITLGEKEAYVTYGVNAITTDKTYSAETHHGTVTVPQVATANATVTINTTPAEGYELKTLTVKKSGDATVTVTKDGNNGSFTMPEENVTVSAEFRMIDYTIDKKPMTNGSVTVKNASDEEISTAHYGDTVTLVAAPDDGFALKNKLQYKQQSNGNMNEPDNASNSWTFTMPASDITVYATFEGAPYDVTISSEITGGAVVSSNLENGQANAGSKVTLTVTPDTGFDLDSLTVTKTADSSAVSVTKESDTIYKFTMPKEAVSVSATFVGKPVTASLGVEGNEGTTCTASLLDSEYKKVNSLTKKAGEEFILSINKDEAHSYKVSFTPNAAVSMRGFSKAEYQAYINSTKSESLNTYLYWVTMPGVNADSVNMTVTFATAKTFTILYQPTESANEVWVKFGKSEDGQDKLVTAKMSKDAAMGDVAVWSLKMSAAFNPNKIAFATSESAAESVGTQTATVSDATFEWNTITGTNDKYLIIGNNAKTVIAAFTDDSSSANANRDATVISIGDNATYQIAICASGGSGSVTTPAAPTKAGYDFVAWRGYEGITAKDYDANTQISVKENMTFSAVWQPESPNVKLNLNGGTGIDNTEFTVTYDTTLPSLTPVKSGYSFAGWSVAKDVTEDGKVYTNGAPFDTGTKITADLELTAQWKHVHAYGCVQIEAVRSLATKYAAYAPYLHIKICGCGDVDLEAHSLNSDGVCACGYSKSGATPTIATLDISYGQWLNGNYTQKMAEVPEDFAVNSEVSVSAPGKWGNLTFSKWQYKAEGDAGWTDAGAYKMMSFVIPGNMEMRALYVNATTVPEVSMSATTYATTAANMDGEFNSILFQMNYKLPDGYTYVDAGVRSGDNAGISYYELKERTATMDAEAKAITYSLAAAMSVLQGQVTTFDTSGTEQYYAKRENSVLDESGMTEAKLGEYMYQSKPINIKDPPLYWNYKPTVTGQSGSINALTPVGFAQRNNGDHYIYAIAYLTYKDRNGTTHTIYTDALPATVNILLGDNKPAPVSKSGS